MAGKARSTVETEPPADWTPTQAVSEPIINSPYKEPASHWVYQGGVPFQMAGRRQASYFFKTEKTGTGQQQLFADEDSDDLPLVNCLRKDVRRWRESGYRGASPVTKELLSWWMRSDRPRPLFFCQREAVETMIYLLEMALTGRLASTGFKNFDVSAAAFERLLKGEKAELATSSNREAYFHEAEFFPRLIDPPVDASLLPLRRLGCKMATGSGKTIVMAMLIAWAFCNRGRNPATTSYPNAVLVCTPNLTVKTRLQVLRPEDAGNYYDAFDIVPPKYRELMGVGRVLITNWHAFAPKSPHREGDASYRVVDKGEESPEAFARDRLGELATRAPILVLNDEGHHCWRPKSAASDATLDRTLTAEEKKALEDEAEEARVWLAGLDRINNAGILGAGKPCVLSCVDLSATPFFLANSGYPQGSPFPWLISDFGLVDAIESGLVKIPRLPVRDDTTKKDEAGRPDPKFFRLWRHINDQLHPVDRLANRRPKPDAVYREAESALITLASQWRARFEELRNAVSGEAFIPPVLIVVCDNTEISEVVFHAISGEKVVQVPSEDGKKAEDKTVYEGSKIFPELANEEGIRRTVRIDSKLLAKAELGEGETRDQAAQALRDIIASVGRAGGPGEQVRCVVSVQMLTEGWDATNVTHILGIRAFDSQLLCEQVVGRGLRRMSYTPDPQTGMLPAEYVDVYGIPFSLIPFKGRPKQEATSDPVYHHVFAVPDRASLEIQMPVVESYTYDLKGSGIECDVSKLEGFIVDHEPNAVYVIPTRGYRDDDSLAPHEDELKQDRKRFYVETRFQQVIFRLAQDLVEDLVSGATGPAADALRQSVLSRQQLFPHITRIVQRYVDTRITFASGVDPRELALEKYMRRARERIREGIIPKVGRGTLLPIVNSYKPTASTEEVNYRTTRPVIRLTKSHLNHAVLHSNDERQAVEILEGLDSIDSYTPNDRNIGLRIPYEYQGAPCNYEPDFIVRMRGGRLVIVEIKGLGGEIHDADRVPAKNAAARKWVEAVNNTRCYGRWEFEFCRDVTNLAAQLNQYATAQIVPFRRVTADPSNRFKTCVPLTTLRAAAGQWSQSQLDLDPLEWATDWVAYDTTTRFEPGMFVARVEGESMSPTIPSGSYCLFRGGNVGPSEGKILLMWHEGISDPETGGHYTVKVFSSDSKMGADGARRLTRVRLKPLNPAHEPIVLTPDGPEQVGVIAEFVEVLPAEFDVTSTQ